MGESEYFASPGVKFICSCYDDEYSGNHKAKNCCFIPHTEANDSVIYERVILCNIMLKVLHTTCLIYELWRCFFSFTVELE